jgi:hypothetical protein
MNSGSTSGAGGGTGFLIKNKHKSALKSFTPIIERIYTLRMKAKFFNISRVCVCVYAPTEAADRGQRHILYPIGAGDRPNIKT